MPTPRSDADRALNLRAGEVVQVRSKSEILARLDAQARTDALPFMPEMLQHCGKTYTVYKRAHKTCDTISSSGARRMANAVHLAGVRCDGSAHGGCQAGCLIFWKEEWLKRTDTAGPGDSSVVTGESIGVPSTLSDGTAQACSEQTIVAATRRQPNPAYGNEVLYACQATELPNATQPLAWWDLRQYVTDIGSGNVSFGEFARGTTVSSFNLAIRTIRRGLMALNHRVFRRSPESKQDPAVIGNEVAQPRQSPSAMRRITRLATTTVHNLLVEYPHVRGTLSRTPSTVLDLQVGESAIVKSKNEIVATLDTNNRNRGLLFDAEMVPYCEGTYRVLRRVERIVDEKTGRMRRLPNPCVILDGVVCGGCLSPRRLFCPRSIYSYWHEIWLKRVP